MSAEPSDTQLLESKRLLHANRDQLFENIEKEVEKELVEINHSNLLKNFHQVNSPSSVEPQLTNLWISQIYTFILLEVLKVDEMRFAENNKTNVKYVEYGPFTFTTFIKLWKLPFSIASSTNVSLKGSSNQLTRRLADIEIENFSKVNYEGYLLKNIKQMEDEIFDRVRKLNISSYISGLQTLLQLTSAICFDRHEYRLAAASENGLASEFSVRVIRPVVGFLSLVFSITLTYHEDRGLEFGNNLPGDSLKDELESLGVSSSHMDTVVTMNSGSANEDVRDKKVLFIEHRKAPMVSKMTSTDELEMIKSILLQTFSYKVCSNGLECGIINDLSGSLLVIFESNNFKYTEDGLFSLENVQVYQVNDVEFFHQVNNKGQQLNSRILVSMMIYMKLKNFMKEDCEQKTITNQNISGMKIKIKQKEYRESLELLNAKFNESIEALHLKKDEKLSILKSDEPSKGKKRTLISSKDAASGQAKRHKGLRL